MRPSREKRPERYPAGPVVMVVLLVRAYGPGPPGAAAGPVSRILAQRSGGPRRPSRGQAEAARRRVSAAPVRA
ncbi:hypothetical protein GCM10010305_60700 [Streptomyces termitum]|uniref:Uncharacterized protein n=1 Tax=Streptomyces termitum TaxID=67368 RepID=A0A918WDU0_9ACTN|nr:hypothetical protein GCM10010305_60700 [Streptomyces termitum]